MYITLRTYSWRSKNIWSLIFAYYFYLNVHSVISCSNMKECYVTSLLGQNIFALQMNMLHTCYHSSAQMETLIDNVSAKAIIIDLLV